MHDQHAGFGRAARHLGVARQRGARVPVGGRRGRLRQRRLEVLDAIERVKAKGTHWYTDNSGKRRLHGHWSGKNTEAIARDVGWENAYNTLFREASQYIHPGVHGFTGYFRFNDPPGWVTIDAAPSAEGVRGVMASVNIYFAHVLRAWADVLGIEAVADPLRAWMDEPPQVAQDSSEPAIRPADFSEPPPSV